MVNQLVVEAEHRDEEKLTPEIERNLSTQYNQEPSKIRTQRKKPGGDAELNRFTSIGANGFEPSTSCSQGRRANQAALRPAVTA